MAAIALLGVLSVGLVLLVIALAVLFTEAGLLLLTILAPIFLIAGVFPPTRKALRRWGESMVMMLVRRVGYAAVLVAALVGHAVVVAQATSLEVAWGITLLVEVALAGAAIWVVVFKMSDWFDFGTDAAAGTLARRGGRAARRHSRVAAGKLAGVARRRGATALAGAATGVRKWAASDNGHRQPTGQPATASVSSNGHGSHTPDRESGPSLAGMPPTGSTTGNGTGPAGPPHTNGDRPASQVPDSNRPSPSAGPDRAKPPPPDEPPPAPGPARRPPPQQPPEGRRLNMPDDPGPGGNRGDG